MRRTLEAVDQTDYLPLAGGKEREESPHLGCRGQIRPGQQDDALLFLGQRRNAALEDLQIAPHPEPGVGAEGAFPARIPGACGPQQAEACFLEQVVLFAARPWRVAEDT